MGLKYCGGTLHLTVLLAAVSGVAGGQTTLTSLSPQTVAAGGTDFVLKVFGTNFPPGTVIVWTRRETNPKPMFITGTVQVSSTELDAGVAAPMIAASGTIDISLNVVS